MKSHTSSTSSPRLGDSRPENCICHCGQMVHQHRPLQLALVSRWLQRGRKARCRSLASLNVLTPATVTVETQKYLIVEKKYYVMERSLIVVQTVDTNPFKPRSRCGVKASVKTAVSVQPSVKTSVKTTVQTSRQVAGVRCRVSPRLWLATVFRRHHRSSSSCHAPLLDSSCC